MMRIGKSLILVWLCVSALTAMADAETPPAQSQLSLADMRTFTDVFNQIRNNFVDEISDQELLNAAIRGMLAELDPHSAYMEADEYRDLENSSRGQYSGIGVELLIRDKRINVVAVMEGGAAKNAGIVAGDIITAIDKTALRKKNLQAAIDSLRGQAGSEVKVTVRHENGEVSSYKLTRDYVKVASVFSSTIDQYYGYFNITHFTRKTADEMLEQVNDLQDKRQKPLKGVILDLRNNPGGVLQPAVTIADGFLDDGLIVQTSGRAPNQMNHTAKAGQWLGNIPLVVLVNSGSASASEVLAGALQDHGRALIVGQRTFGKGTVQSVLTMRNGSGVRLTTSRYYTPSGRSIQAEGIQPDVETPTVKIDEEADEKRREADLERHLDRETESDSRAYDSEIDAADDYMMYQALILLKAASMLSPDTK